MGDSRFIGLIKELICCPLSLSCQAEAGRPGIIQGNGCLAGQILVSSLQQQICIGSSLSLWIRIPYEKSIII